MRSATEKRETGETYVEVALNIDGSGKCDCQVFGQVDLSYLKRMLRQMMENADFDFSLKAKSKDGSKHHLTEDIAIVFGGAFKKGLSGGEKIKRYASTVIPMEGNLAEVAVGLGEKPYCKIRKLELRNKTLEQEIYHFFETFAVNGDIDLSVRVDGENDHHKVEAICIGLGMVLKKAVEIVR